MPRQITQYRIFIASPGGLDAERQRFRDRLHRHTLTHAEPKGVMFQPVGWEDTTGGAGRPQELINEDIRQCDYAVFVLHDRWGSPAAVGSDKTGVEEEWELVEELYKSARIRNIALFFKSVDQRQMGDPGPQLAKVLCFKAKIEAEKRYLFRQYDTLDQFADTLDAHLANWLRDHEGRASDLSAGRLDLTDEGAPPEASPSDSAFWLAEAIKLSKGENPDHSGTLFCATRAIDLAKSDLEWATATNAAGIAQADLGRLDEALADFTAVAERLAAHTDPKHAQSRARALCNKGLTLGDLGRHQDAITAFDEVIARFGTATDVSLSAEVARALFSKGFALGSLARPEDEVPVYDEVIARFGTRTEPPLREQVARALINKGVALGVLGRTQDEIAIYDEVVTRFGTTTEVTLSEEIARALVNKGIALGTLGRPQDEISTYDEVISRFESAAELPLREQVGRALVNKGKTLCDLGRQQDAIMVCDEVIARFGTATEPSLRLPVARALLTKGISLDGLGRQQDAIAVCDEVVTRFGTATEPLLREQVDQAETLTAELRQLLKKGRKRPSS